MSHTSKRRPQAAAIAATLAVVALLAFAHNAAAETDPPPPSDVPAVGTTHATSSALTESSAQATATTKPTETTLDWAQISPTDEWGNTLYPPPPSETTVPATTTQKPTNKSTTTTVKTTAKRTNPPFVYNPGHPEDTYSGSIPLGRLPNFFETRKGETLPPTLPEELEPALEPESQDFVNFEEIAGMDEAESETGPMQLIIGAAAVVGLLLAGFGMFLVLRKKPEPIKKITPEPEPPNPWVLPAETKETARKDTPEETEPEAEGD
jgi:hypothetical protein